MSTDEKGTKYPGVATDKADNDKVNECLVKEDVREMNNNPRNSDEQMP